MNGGDIYEGQTYAIAEANGVQLIGGYVDAGTIGRINVSNDGVLTYRISPSPFDVPGPQSLIYAFAYAPELGIAVAGGISTTETIATAQFNSFEPIQVSNPLPVLAASRRNRQGGIGS